MTTRKTILGASVLLAVATVAGAAERTRSTDPTIADPSTSNTPNYSMVDASTGTVELNGQSSTVRADGTVVLDEVMSENGSLIAYFADAALADVKVSKASDDTLVYANGVVALMEGFLPVNDPALPVVITLDDRKDTMQWVEQDFGGTSVVVFADGAVLADMAQVPVWVTLRNTIPNSVNSDGEYVYANGAIGINDPGSIQ